MSHPKAEYDSPWKLILDVYFEQFMAYITPAHERIFVVRKCEGVDLIAQGDKRFVAHLPGIYSDF